MVLLLANLSSLNSGDSNVEVTFDKTTASIYAYVFTFLFTGSNRFLLYSVVLDKETKMRESMKIMSLSEINYAMGFFFSEAILTTFISVALTIGMTRFISWSSVPLFFLALELLGLNLICMSLVLTNFFTDSKLSVLLGSLILSIP
jgi:hypothetical protein